MNQKAEYIRLKWKEIFPWVLAAAAVVSSNLASVAIWEFFESDKISFSRILYVAVFIAVVTLHNTLFTLLMILPLRY